MRRYYLQSGLWMGVFTLLILGGLYVAADLNATDDSPSNALNIDGGFWSDTGTGFALDKMSGRSTKIALGPNANAVVSVDLIGDSGAGNQRDDGVTSGTVSGQGTKIAVEVFAIGVTTSLVGMQIEFDFDASVLKFDKAENSAFLFIIPEATGASLAGAAPVTLPASGFLARAEFSTVSDVTGQEFTLGIKSVTLAESAASSDVTTTTNAISFNAALSPDFDGDGTVGFSDFLAFAGQYGARQGDGRYQAKYDLDGNGAIDFSDFLTFAGSYGTQVPPSGGGGGGGGGSPDLVVESPSVSDNTLTTRQSFTLRATVRNSGTGQSASTTLRYYQSSNATISRSDTEVGTDSVNGLSASGTSAESISLNAPSSVGTYYYGACVESVSGESDTNNNCSSAVRVTVSQTTSGFAPADQQAFNSLVVGKRIKSDNFFVDFESAGRFTESSRRDQGSYTYSNTGANTGTLTQNYDAGLYGGRCTTQLTFTSTTTGTLRYTCDNGDTGEEERWQLFDLTTPIFVRANADTLVFAFLDTWSARQTRAYDFQFRKKTPQGSWDGGCIAYPNESSNSVTTYAVVRPYGLQLNTTYEMRYRYRNSSSCNTGSPGPYSAIAEGTTSSSGSGVGGGGSSGGGSTTTIDIPDANLRAVVADSLGKVSGAPITRAEMATLARLDAPNKGIRSLTGLEHATNLQVLRLGSVRVNGERVNSNDISNLSPLSNLTNLTFLDLDYNSISDISALSNLTNLTELWLGSNSISDISALSNLTNLTTLGLGGNSISDISALSNLTNLTTLGLGGNSISDISALSNLTNLTELILYRNSISDISALSNLTNLTTLWLYRNSISDISALSNLTNLTTLILFNNSISDLAPLVTNTGLGSGDEVDVRSNPLSATSINTHIPALQGRGINVQFGSSKPAVVEKETRLPRAAMKRLEGEEWEDAGDRKWMEIKQDMISQKARRESK